MGGGPRRTLVTSSRSSQSELTLPSVAGRTNERTIRTSWLDEKGKERIVVLTPERSKNPFSHIKNKTWILESYTVYRICTVILFEDLRYISPGKNHVTRENESNEFSSDWNGSRDDYACSWDNFFSLSLSNKPRAEEMRLNARSYVYSRIRVEHRPSRRTYSLPPQLGHTQVIVSHAHAHALTHAIHTHTHTCIHTYVHTHSRNNTSHGLTSLCG